MKKILFLSAILSSFFNICASRDFNKFALLAAIDDSTKTSISALKDTTVLQQADSLKKNTVKKITPIKELGFLDSCFSKNILNKEYIIKNDYRYTGNFIPHAQFGFLRDFGNVGQPAEALIYGQGYSNSTYLADGINITNRLTNSFDLNFLQSEDIEQIEIIPLAQGFLYGNNNNTAAVNFISKEFMGNIPYTRIKFYQGIYNEGFFDGIFNSSISNKISLFAEITNQSAERRYKNSGQSSWLASARLRYIPADNINIITGYRYAKANTPLNGGVDLDSILSINSTDDIDNILYNNIQAPVNYINRYQKVTSNNFYLKTIAAFIPFAPTSLTFYYQDILNEFRQNDSTSKSNLQENVASINNNNRYKTIGINLNQAMDINNISLRAIAGYEYNSFASPLLLNDSNINSAWLSGHLKFSFFNGIIKPTFFAKYLRHDNNNLGGYGADFTYNITSDLSVYAGYSKVERYYNILLYNSSSENYTNKNFETAVSYENSFIRIQTGYFRTESEDAIIPIFIKSIDGSSIKNESAVFLRKNIANASGFNVNMNILFWRLVLTANSSYYFSQTDRNINGLPDFTSHGGIYYVDTLFNSNLKLKAGINYSTIGTRNNLYYDFQKNIPTTFAGTIDPAASGSIQYLSQQKISPDFQLDFFVAGQIQDNATLYFTFENILNSKYYIIPYYPMYESGMRFGVAWEFFN